MSYLDPLNCYISRLWQYGLWSFQTVCTKLERFLPKNQHTKRKLLNFENWVYGEVSKIRHQKMSIKKDILQWKTIEKYSNN